MQLDYTPRASGKTTRLLIWLTQDEKRVMLTFNLQEANRLREYIQNTNSPEWVKKINPNQIQSFEEYKRRVMNISTIKEIAIDNADIILQQQISHPITKITITDENN